MPTYHVHSTTIKLYVWDPLQPPKVTKNQETPYASDVACRHDVEPLKEEYFEGQEGVDFLGSSMPFFLINAGRDLFFKTLQTSGGIAEVEALVDESQDGEVPVEEDLKPSGVPPSMHPKVIKPPTYVFDGPDSDSGLSSIPFPIFAGSNPLGNEDSTSQRKISSATRKSKPRGWRKLPPKPQGKPRTAVSKPITSAKPIKIQIDLTRKSFMKSIYTNNAHDICVNIFYNGEFAYSKVLRSRTASSYTAEEKEKHFCGRRVDTNLEVPWVVLPATQDDASTAGTPRGCSSFEDRWNMVNQLLLTEADEWGRTGKYDMFRAPVGEYLEELSKKPVPESMKKQGTMGHKAGIIDVVISVGRSMTINQWSNLTKPRRKLPEDFCGKERKLYVVPEELNPRHKAQIIADFEREEIARAATRSITKKNPPTPSVEDDVHFSTRVTTAKIPLNDSACDQTFTATKYSAFRLSKPVEHDSQFNIRSLSQDTVLDNAATRIQEEPSLSQPLALTTQPFRSQRGGSLPTMSSSSPTSRTQQRARTKSTTLPTTPVRERPQHPNRPKVTPQKSYKGPSPPARPQKVENPWEFLPFDAEKSVSHSTRSKRSAAKPVFTPENLRGQELVDSYLTLRNRQLGALSSTPVEHSPLFKLHRDGETSILAASSDIGSSPCRLSTRANRNHESNSRARENDDVSMDGGLGMDGAGDARKSRLGGRMASENTPTRSSKRKRPSSGSPNTPLGEGDEPAIQPLKSFKRTKVIFKDNAGSDDTISRVEQETHSADTTGMGVALMETPVEAQRESILGQTEEEVNKKQSRPSRAMSARELNGLLTPHKPAKGVNTSFGASFVETSSTRSTRNKPAKQKEAAGETGTQISNATTSLTAIYKKPILAIKGIKGINGVGGNTRSQTPARNAIDVTKSDSTVPPQQVQNKDNMAKLLETLAETTQLELVAQPPRPKTPNSKAKVAIKQTARRIETVKATNSAALISADNSKETNTKDPTATLAKASKPEPTVAKNVEKSKANTLVEVHEKTKNPEMAQAQNFKQSKVKNMTQETTGASLSTSNSQATRNNKRVKTERLPELGGVSKSEIALQTTTHAEKTAVFSLQYSTVRPQPMTMAPPPTKAPEKTEQPVSALLEVSELGSGVRPSLAQNGTKSNAIEEPKILGRLPLQSNPVQKSKEAAKNPVGKVVATKPETKVQSSPQRVGENLQKSAVKSSTIAKPNLAIDIGMGNAHSSRSYSTTSQGMKTPTPRSGTFATPTNTKMQTKFTRARSSSITVKDTPGTGSTTVMLDILTPSVPARQESAMKPARRRPPPLNLVPNSSATPSAPATTTAVTTPTGRLNSRTKEPPTPTPSASADLVWKPNSLCIDSVLSYATAQMVTTWSEKEYLTRSGFANRNTKTEREAVFRANGILMGVRFVLGVGRDEDEDVEMKG